MQLHTETLNFIITHPKRFKFSFWSDSQGQNQNVRKREEILGTFSH